jgi:hypothetical protein
LRDKEHELEAIVDSDDEPEPVKAEAQRELEAIAQFMRKRAATREDSAQRASRAVRMAINRFHYRLETAIDSEGKPHQTLHAFAAHLERHLLVPSSRYSRRRLVGQDVRFPGCFIYEPPAGVIWQT